MTGHVVVLSTAGSEEEAERIAKALVEQRLAACVNVLPGLVSFYRWKGTLERSEERLLIIKTRADRVPDLQATLKTLHSYEVPELLALSVESGNPSYLAWLDENLGSAGSGS